MILFESNLLEQELKSGGLWSPDDSSTAPHTISRHQLTAYIPHSNPSYVFSQTGRRQHLISGETDTSCLSSLFSCYCLLLPPCSLCSSPQPSRPDSPEPSSQHPTLPQTLQTTLLTLKSCLTGIPELCACSPSVVLEMGVASSPKPGLTSFLPLPLPSSLLLCLANPPSKKPLYSIGSRAPRPTAVKSQGALNAARRTGGPIETSSKGVSNKVARGPDHQKIAALDRDDEAKPPATVSPS